jgi:hypothetical protein
MFAILVAAPAVVIVYSLLFLETVSVLPVWHLALMAVGYVAMPLAVSRFLIKKSGAFIYVVMGQCLLLLGMAFIPAAQVPVFLFYLHYGLVFAMVVLALMMINRDLLFPFIFAEQRGFRREPRVEINHPVTLIHPNGKDEYRLLIDDCSITGMAVYGNAEDLDALLQLLSRGQNLMLRSAVRKQKFELVLSFQWQTVDSGVAKIGFRATDQELMGQFFKALGPKASTHGSRIRFKQIWARKPGRRLINYGVAVALLATMTLPPLMVPENREAVAKKLQGVTELVGKPQKPAKKVSGKKKKKNPKKQYSH